jgi:hypothetical protein
MAAMWPVAASRQKRERLGGSTSPFQTAQFLLARQLGRAALHATETMPEALLGMR